MKNIRKMYLIMILLIVISISISPVIGGNNNQSISNNSINQFKKQVNYRITIDQYHGFINVYIANKSGTAILVPYNGTLNITKGDTITWINDAMPDARLTIISQQKLWSNNSGNLKWAYKQFSYTFNKSGTYDIYIKEYSRFQQKIIVGPLESSSNDMTKKNISSQKNKTISNSSNGTNATNKITNATNKITNVTNKITNVTNKITNATKSPKAVNSNNSTNISKNEETNNKINRTFIILPIMVIISIILIKSIQKS